MGYKVQKNEYTHDHFNKSQFSVIMATKLIASVISN